MCIICLAFKGHITWQLPPLICTTILELCVWLSQDLQRLIPKWVPLRVFDPRVTEKLHHIQCWALLATKHWVSWFYIQFSKVLGTKMFAYRYTLNIYIHVYFVFSFRLLFAYESSRDSLDSRPNISKLFSLLFVCKAALTHCWCRVRHLVVFLVEVKSNRILSAFVYTLEKIPNTGHNMLY